MIDRTKLSKIVSLALRHEPWLFELELDDRGWTSTESLLTALRAESPGWAELSRDDLARMIATAAKPRHEMQGHKIRALYGHSTPDVIAMVQSVPPEELFHGTSPASTHTILAEGLRPMGRQYVHLSKDTHTADLVGSRKAPNPVILSIDAKAANLAGLPFYRGSDIVWLANQIPAEFIDILPTSSNKT
ncbi:RNA 2'-phosphotransferase [Arthrobacter glacialis]|uniref:Probable RNA 2'-phosphotransferase n=1 Tax=Arthrobacter glacialis TaxID=1664 RepID=A0A2S3ZS42_ARTGL|nr:RNA 2'-phosphotransferase [Arthrobacter glacialis]POH71929.1 RNA 2'-phosphotransferase [Arthrobacter glacialis]